MDALLNDSFNAALIVGIIVTIVVIIAVVAFIVVTLFPHMKKNFEAESSERRFELIKALINKDNTPADRYCRVVASSKDEAESNVPAKCIESVLSNLYPEDYARPTMKDALEKAGLTEEQTNMVCSICETAISAISDEGKLFDGFIAEDAAAVTMYTYDFGANEFENNPYRIINKGLVGRNFAEL